jgi:non-ribosomal peptide synthase protein (TIGR01720 family)
LEYIDWVMKNIPRNGLGFDILKYLRPITSKKESLINLLVGNNETLFNYIGDYDENNVFQSSWSKDNMKQINLIYSADQNTSKSAKWTHDFNIYLIIIENKLFIHIQFSLLEYKNETINKMLDLYKKTIANLIEDEENYDV